MPSELTSLNQAKSQILSALNAISNTEILSVELALNRVLAEDIISPINVPAYDNSAMDGFAFDRVDFDSQESITVSQRITAGDTATVLSNNSAARIFTGAMIPENTLTVIPQELCDFSQNNSLESNNPESNSYTVKVNKIFSSNENIRRKGQDVEQGELVFKKGRRLKAQDIGMLASLGLAKVLCLKKIKVAIISTGNELLDPGAILTPGKIFNSNRFMLQALLREMEVDVTVSATLGDKLELIEERLLELAESHDCLITTGGVSVGETDFVKQALDRIGSIDLWKLAIKPGKPFTFGKISKAYFFGLPGNPVAAFVTFLMLVKPALSKVQGESSEPELVSFLAKSNFDHPANKKRMEFLRVKLSYVMCEGIKQPSLTLYGNQSSGVLNSTCASDGFAILELGKSIKQGELLEFIPYSSFS